ncbi:hypothetical protein [Bordetella genomosp. 7]|uniref:Uncharacterized protein n=1 Tax=Bordetella genomosp. 7 TaxID=1416805 RepID=A0A261QYQ2_9BORD|nr:hypothetical protein [Bordetella genomosp. 7]OZI17918.1 hypothetical protein CAL19_12610 [Bordetella genomosp. 7]
MIVQEVDSGGVTVVEIQAKGPKGDRGDVTPEALAAKEAAESAALSAESYAELAGNGVNSIRADLADASTENSGAGMVAFKQNGTLAASRRMLEKSREWVTPEDFAHVDDDDDGPALARAASSGANSIRLLPGKTYAFDSVDFNSVDVWCEGTATLSGTPINVGRIGGGVIVGGAVSAESVRETMPQLKFSGGFVVRYRSAEDEGDDGFYVVTKNAHREEYVSIRVRASAAADTGPWELQRIQSVFALGEALAYQSVAEAAPLGAVYSGSGWANYSVTPAVIGMESGSTAGTPSTAIACRRTATVDDSVSFSVKPDKNGQIKLTFLKSASMSRSVEISYLGVGGAVTETISLEDASASGPSLHTVILQTRSLAAIPITVTQKDSGTSSRYMVLVAVNADRPDELRREVAYDNYATFQLPSYRHYVTNAGAHEYAIYDNDAEPPSFTGSYHGREEALIPPKWVIDGQAVELFPKGVPVACKRGILLKQSTQISGKLTTYSDYRFGDGSAEFICDIQGTMRSRTVYLGMELSQLYNATADKACFNEILYPRRTDVTDAGRYPLGNTELVVWRNSETEARIYMWCKSFTGYASLNGGSSIESAYGTSTYSKLRCGQQQDAERLFTGASLHYIKVYG